MTAIISVLNQKGGVGKTTIATNLTHGLILKGFKTLLVDGDPQGSARDWHEANEGGLVPCIGLDRETIAQDLKSLSNDYDIIVIDGAPRIERLAALAIRVSDIVLIPVQPSPYDIWSTADLVELIKTRQEVTEGKPKAAFIISRQIKNTRLSHEILQPLHDYGFPVLNSRTSQYVAYSVTADSGRSVFSASFGHSSQPTLFAAEKEMGDLVEEVISKYIDINNIKI